MKRIYSLVALGAAATLALSACSSSNDNGGKKATVDSGSASTVAFTTGADEYAGYNNFLSSTYSTGNSVVNDRLQTGFGYYDPEGNWIHGTDLGDYEVLSEDPLTVKYTINEKAVYQGGTPITCEDYYMDWVAQNPKWIQDGQIAAGNADDAGNAESLFNHVSDAESYANPVADGPQCEAGDREFTITYSEPNPDWELVVSGALPSHVIADKIGLTKEELFEAFKNQDFEVAQQAAEEWNNWIAENPGELQSTEEAPSFGPFTYKEGGWKAGEYVTLVPNPDWWGEAPGVDELVIKQIAPEGQLQALQNGDVNVIEPQATQDTLDQLNAMDNVTVLEGSTMIWEHLDFNFGDTSVFSEGQGGQALREAFAYCVPRQDIVDQLIKPLNSEAVVMNAREYFPGDEDYDEVVEASYDGRYDTVDIDKAKEKVAESGVSNPTVRIGYSSPNQRRSDTVDLIRSSCEEAGFTIEDAGSTTFFDAGGELDQGAYDVALFAWNGSGQVVSGANIQMTTGGQNFGGYSNATVDEEWGKVLTSVDPDVWLSSKKIIEKEEWDTLFNIPMYQHPGIVGHTDGLQNVERTVVQTGVSWNAEKWAW